MNVAYSPNDSHALEVETREPDGFGTAAAFLGAPVWDPGGEAFAGE